ncbi:MAG: metallophosphoesterase family protein [Deltaproteobacteria bacterium]|nr:metallophosphoesterase family protein [Deltaproteobacteria bacterium]
MNKIISVISDTHNFLYDKLEEALKGSDLIIHAGDIGSPDIIERLEKIAKVVAVRGNTDYEAWAEKYNKYETINIFGKTIYLLHSLAEINIDPKEESIDMVIYGHTHRPEIKTVEGVIYLNPGTALMVGGPTFARAEITENNIECKIIKLNR